MKYGAMVRPEDTLRVEITSGKTDQNDTTWCKGTGTVLCNESQETMTAVSGRFTMRPARIE